MANDEDRMTNQTAMTNDKNGGAGVRRGVPFVIVVSSFLRHSDFVIRYYFAAKFPMCD
jgi:hypothetical protein